MARDYKKEYRTYHGKPEQVARRSDRNASRRVMEKAGKVRKGDGKDVDHKNHKPSDKSKGNLRVRSKSANRADNLGRGGRKKGN
jgi:hypothetical protein